MNESGLRSVSSLSSQEIRELMEEPKGTHANMQCGCGEGYLIVREGYDKFLRCSCFPKCKNVYKPQVHNTGFVPPIAPFRTSMDDWCKEIDDMQYSDDWDKYFYSGGIHCASDM